MIESAVDKLVDDGVAEKDRVAITGLSGGAEAVNYALQHTDRFAAAIASSGVHDVTFLALVAEGPWRQYLMENFGTSKLVPPMDNGIYKLAWSAMPQKLKTPFLVNVGEYEALLGFEGIKNSSKRGDRSRLEFSPTSST